MKKSIIILAATALTIAACSRTPKEPTRDELAQSIDSIEQPLMQAAMFESIDTAKGNKLIALYTQFADAFPDDSMTAHYLHLAAQVANGMGLYDEMVTYYDRVIDNYPNYSHLDECFYEKGLALDNGGRKEEAREAYEEFLDEYPDHFLANDIRTAMSLLDMSDEMLSEHLNKINKQ
ncbi:MAG: tetratricopeptide repeat protein [Bacteroidales bacterium]|nr:tetratricopeptide repeat protein [Bacteroidales bacterium]